MVPEAGVDVTATSFTVGAVAAAPPLTLWVEALPGSDQPLVPSSLVARTCTSYSVSSASPVIVALNAVLVVFVTSVHPGASTSPGTGSRSP